MSNSNVNVEKTKKTKVDPNEPSVINGTEMIIKLRKLRNDRDLSQHELAVLCDMTVPNLQKYEYGKMKSIPFLTLERLCNVLNCKPGDLIDMNNVQGVNSEKA
ncbi:helix-turn-helix transcriptional regulator [Microcoleus sp. S13_C5]